MCIRDRAHGGREVLLHLLGARIAQPESLSRHAGAHLDRSDSTGGGAEPRRRTQAPTCRRRRREAQLSAAFSCATKRRLYSITARDVPNLYLSLPCFRNRGPSSSTNQTSFPTAGRWGHVTPAKGSVSTRESDIPNPPLPPLCSANPPGFSPALLRGGAGLRAALGRP